MASTDLVFNGPLCAIVDDDGIVVEVCLSAVIHEPSEDVCMNWHSSYSTCGDLFNPAHNRHYAIDKKIK
jgi:hypothetical protein